MPAFVVQKHAARTLHYDFRLEKDGVLKSWAVPKSIPAKPGIKRLAVETEDHALAYAGFEGTIPEGEYGAGQVETWDAGTYAVETWLADRIVFRLDGSRLQGRYCLLRFKKAGDKTWLLFAI
jgi:bifunctional non-homologous end joining protein LigD